MQRRGKVLEIAFKNEQASEMCPSVSPQALYVRVAHATTKPLGQLLTMALGMERLMDFDSGEKGLWEMVSGLCGGAVRSKSGKKREQEAPKSTVCGVYELVWANAGKMTCPLRHGVPFDIATQHWNFQGSTSRTMCYMHYM